MLRLVELETLRLDDYPNLLFVQLRTDAGIVGLGETSIGAEAVESYLHTALAPRLLGRTVSGVAPIARELVGYVGYVGTGVEMRARSALDIALWDLIARADDVPLAEALGGAVRDRIRTYNTCAGPEYARGRHHQAEADNWGLPNGPSARVYEDLQATLEDPGGLARDLLDAGITGMKIWPFDTLAERVGGQHLADADLDRALEPLRQIRDAVGDAIDVMIELHGLWSLPMATKIAVALEQFDPYWLEDPIRPDDVESLRTLAARTRIPLAVGETLGGASTFQRLVERRAADIVIFDVGWCGGLTEARRIATVAASRSLPVAPHDCTGPVVLTASTHLSSHLENAIIQESVRAYLAGWYRELVTVLPTIEEGQIRPPTGPGLGTELRPDLSERPDVRRRVSRAS